MENLKKDCCPLEFLFQEFSSSNLKTKFCSTGPEHRDGQRTLGNVKVTDPFPS